MAEIRKKISLLKVLGLFFSIILIGLAFTFWPKPVKINVAYTKVYRLVEEKISQNAAIQINLPKSIKFSPEMAQAVSFQPEILGKWVASTTQNQLIYQPKDPLVLNHYYQATLALAENNKISADFMVVEDPAIIAIFPNKDSEANEYSDITIVFNRPMVPLTTLSVSEAKDLPVEITPKTEGHYKWITTSNLKFIPKERLLRSSNYKVTIKSGLVSMDNLSLKGAEVQFQTRPLRYIDLEQNTAAYNQPIILKFNQPVDLEKIKKEIAVTRITSSLSLTPPMPGQKPVTPTGESVPVLIQYRSLDENEKIGKNNVSANPSFGWLNNLTAALKLNFLPSASNQNGTVDKTTLEIYGLKDRFGRAKMWDANNNYKLVINKAYPEEGDIILNESRQIAFNVTDVVSSVSAESDRTSYAQSDFFDPKGKLWISFYEDMDLNAMRINSAHLKETGYGEKCKDA
ncbi:MAG: Ig-like domain-containing protein, partial [Candidatus Parcubacteria bacterium]|nr:Ig-like domain-containing protein [Candidatus Parcubacteria bacterium]